MPTSIPGTLDRIYIGRLPTEHEVDDQPNEPQPLFTTDESVKSRFVHPTAKKMFELCPWTRKIPLFGEASEGYGPACISSLAMSYLLCKGIADHILTGATYAMLVDRYGISAERYQRLGPITGVGWSIRPFTAALCDTFAFLGYTKRWYMFISCILGAVFALVYGFLPAEQSSANTAVALIFLSCWGKANVDILSEGHYSRLIRKHPEQGPALVSFVWCFIMLGSLVAACINGPLADAGKQQIGVFISAALQFVTGVIYLFNLYGEDINRVERAEDARLLRQEFLVEREKARLLAAHIDADEQELNDAALHDSIDEEDDPHNYTAKEGQLQVQLEDPTTEDWDYEVAQPGTCLFGIFEINKEVAQRNWKVFVYCGVMTCATVALTCGSILADTLGMLLICVVVFVICCCTSFWSLPLIIAKANVFGYLQEATYLQLPIADSFFLAKPDCLPRGPHFSYTFYNTVGNTVGGATGILGVTAFNYIFAKHSYRLAFITTTVLRVVAGLFDIIMVKRWNEDVGMPDHAMYICGDAVIGRVCYMLNWMPMTILISRLCPRGSESVVYALMAAFNIIGQTASAQIASAIMEWNLPVNSEARPCTGFEDNLPWLLFIGHMCTPLIVIPLTLLVPACRICDDIDIEAHHSSTVASRKGSPSLADDTAGMCGHGRASPTLKKKFSDADKLPNEPGECSGGGDDAVVGVREGETKGTEQG